MCFQNGDLTDLIPTTERQHSEPGDNKSGLLCFYSKDNVQLEWENVTEVISMYGLIREIRDENQIKKSVAVIRESFETVAWEFNLTQENCPTHPSFVTYDRMMELYRKGLHFFALFADDKQTGFVAIERADETLYYMEKLAVVPPERHQGYGTQLVRFVCDYVAGQGARKLSIGTINEHTVLKDWYKRLGFVETGINKFYHLPFTVCFMEKELVADKLSRTPKAVVLDAMGVIYRAGDDVGELLYPFIAEKGGSTDIIKIRQIARSASLGEISAIDFWKAVGVSPELEDEYLARHRLSRGLTGFLEELRQRGIKVWCLSNDISTWSKKLRVRFGLEEYFSGFIISGDVGFRKPDPTIFRVLMKRMNCEPRDAVFIDDHQKNLDTARALGFQTVLYESTASVPEYTSRVVQNFDELLSLFP